jgi:hypothetical protein
MVTDTIGPCNEDLPTLAGKSPSLGDRGDNAYPKRRHDIFTF